ncbi:hypothetical protein BMS3Abin15_00032 [bacterium BMS3Abin15]|nr:hypothetical protein BMS3Abin15_00032 [bacterium BMS3Abin15]
MKISRKIKNNQKLKAFAALIIGVFIALLISEIILQIFDFPGKPVSGWTNCKSNNPGQCNYLGFRGREITYSPDDFVVILVGDSEVYASSLPFEQIPERRLEHFLQNFKDNVKVFTIADMGYGQDQQYLALKKYFEKHRADLVLLMFTARNDIENNIFPTSGRNNTIKPNFWLENGELRGPTEGWLDPVGPRMKLALLWKSYVGKTIGESRIEMWKKDILPPPYQPLRHSQGEVDYSWQERWGNDPQIANGIKSERQRVGIGNYPTPRSERRTYGINLTRKLFSKIKGLTEENNGHFIIFKEERPWELQDAGREKVYFLNGKYYKTSIRQYQDDLRYLFHGFEHYRIPLNIENYTVKSGDSHLNQQAIDKLFKELSQIISKKNYFR